MQLDAQAGLKEGARHPVRRQPQQSPRADSSASTLLWVLPLTFLSEVIVFIVLAEFSETTVTNLWVAGKQRWVGWRKSEVENSACGAYEPHASG